MTATTPRVDKECWLDGAGMVLQIVSADFARQLERECEELRGRVAELTSDRDAKSKRMWELGKEADAAESRAAALRAALEELVACRDEEGGDWPGTPNRIEWVDRYDRAWQAAKEALQGGGEGYVQGDWRKVEELAQEYVSDYEFRGDAGDHTPTDAERILITDAIMGLIAEDEFIAAIRAAPALSSAQGKEGKNG